jgi:hypothetical protein
MALRHLSLLTSASASRPDSPEVGSGVVGVLNETMWRESQNLCWGEVVQSPLLRSVLSLPYDNLWTSPVAPQKHKVDLFCLII